MNYTTIRTEKCDERIPIPRDEYPGYLREPKIEDYLSQKFKSDRINGIVRFFRARS